MITRRGQHALTPNSNMHAQNPPTRAAKWLRSRLMTGRMPLLTLYLAGTLLLTLGFALYAMQAWQDVKKEKLAELQHQNRLMAEVTHNMVAYQRSMLLLLGERLVKLNDLNQNAESRHLIDVMRQANPALVGFGLARADGQLILVSNIAPGKALPNLLNNPASAESFRQVLGSQEMLMGRTYWFPLFGRWVVPLRYALRDDDGSVKYVMTNGIALETGLNGWLDMKLPAQAKVALIRDDGYYQFVAPQDPAKWAETYSRPLTAEQHKFINAAAYRGEYYAATDMWGTDRIGAVLRIPDLHLTSVLSLPVSALYSSLWDRIHRIAWLYAMFLLTALIAYRLALRLQRSLEKSREDAAARLVQLNLDLERVAFVDPLTGLNNRQHFIDRLDKLEGRSGGIVGLIDISHFSDINVALGTAIGDRVIQMVANRLRTYFRVYNAPVARVGPDIFAVFDARGFISEADLLQQFEAPFIIDDISLPLTASASLADVVPGKNSGIETMKNAESALNRARHMGAGHCLYYEASMSDAARTHLALLGELKAAVALEQFEVYYQPQVDLRSGKLLAVEALVRWQKSDGSFISPAEFIPLAERVGLIAAIDEFVMRTACTQVAFWRKQELPDLRVALNLSAVEMHDQILADRISRILVETRLPAQAVELEITESLMVGDMDVALLSLNRLKQLGVSIALDDFGTGFSSLSYLQQLPIDCIKVDRSFVRGIGLSTQSERIAEVVVALGHTLGLRTLVEGIETEAQLNAMLQWGCMEGQGFYYAKPMPAAEFIAWARARNAVELTSD